MTENSKTPLLDQVNIPSDLRKLDKKLLPQFADELRAEVIDAVSITGGHLGAGLGVVELTTAIHYVFNTPKDKLIFDVGHQCYPHKILTARRDRIRTLRMGGGLSGFTKREESNYDPFGAAHASTSISAGLGMAVARDLNGDDNNVISVIGDGSMSAGMAFEAMNNAGHLGSRLIVVLNDNDMSIAPPVGAMSAYLARMTSSDIYHGVRNFSKELSKSLPKYMFDAIAKAEEYGRGMVTGGTLFEELGFYYVGPIDGHNFNHLLPVLENVKNNYKGPILVHVVTQKGKGYEPAEQAADKYHGVSSFNVLSGKQNKSSSTIPSYTKVFANALIEEAKRDEKIVGITAAMPSGTGMDHFAKEFPDRMFDVGIAEQHAVTFAGGLACEGYKPVCAIYSTFLQRAYDQVVHDIDLQNLPVKFAMDRAGLVGADGPTHAGSFDISFLGCLPNMVIMASADECELMHMTRTATEYDEGPIAFRYPRGSGLGLELPKRGEIITIGKGRIITEGSDVAILNFGGRFGEINKACKLLNENNIFPTIADARFAKPLDTDLINELVKNHRFVITIEEASLGGFGSFVLQYLHNSGTIDKYNCKIRNLTLPDYYMDQDSPEKMYDLAGLSSAKIFNYVMQLVDQQKKIIHMS